MQNTRRRHDLRDRLEADGYTVSTERANSFMLQGNSGALVSGQADLVAVALDGHVTVYDVKTGAQRDSDVAQVMIYMYALPLVAGSPCEGKSLDGRLVYKDDTEKYIPASVIDQDFTEGLHDLIRRIVSDKPARRVPSPPECNWCDLTDLDCPERVDSDLPNSQNGSASAGRRLEF